MTEAESIDPREHIHQDDPRYDGFRITEYWAATAVAPDDQEAPLFVTRGLAATFDLAPGPAFATDARRLVRLRDFAAWAADQFQCEVRVRHFVPEGEDEVYGTES